MRDLIGRLDTGGGASEIRITAARLGSTSEPSIWDGFIPEPVLPEELSPGLEREVAAA